MHVKTNGMLRRGGFVCLFVFNEKSTSSPDEKYYCHKWGKKMQFVTSNVICETSVNVHATGCFLLL